MKMTDVVHVALNGDAPKVDAAIRRTLYAVAAQHDAQTEQLIAEVKGVRKLLLTLTGTVVTGLILVAANILVTL